MSYHPPYYKRFPRDYLSSSTTRRMTLAEHGIYNLLLDYAWLEEQTATLPANLTILAKLTGIDRRILSRFTVKYQGIFCKVPGDSQRIYNPRQKSEYDGFLEICDKKRLAGLESARVRKSKSTPVQQKPNHSDTDTDTDTDIRVREEKKHHAASVPPSDSLELETKDAAFSLFWEKWPRKQAKSDARRAWMKIPISEYPAIMSGLEKWRTSDQWKRGVIPHPATWLNEKRWQDEDIPQFGGSNGSTKKLTGEALTTANLKAAGFVQ
ncbi:MAG: DUF1376 domain-containing protein [Candidatus Acidiferrales bacterium]